MLTLAIRNLSRRRLRTLLTISGIAAAVAVLASLLAFGQGYRSGLNRELNAMGIQMMLVPIGCPYDAAARVIKGKALDVSLPDASLGTVRADSAVAVAAPVLMAAIPRPTEGRTDLWVGVDRDILPLKSWWKMKQGSTWFTGPDSVILGAEAAATELRQIGDPLYSPETGKTFRVCAILERSGTTDDSQFFIPIATAQNMFDQHGRLTAVAIRLKDPSLLAGAADRLQQTPGAQIVTMGEMMGTFLNLVETVRTLLLAIGAIAAAIGALTVFNTMLASVVERAAELGMLRAVGASRLDLFLLLGLESSLLAICGAMIGVAAAATLGPWIEKAVRTLVPMAPEGALLHLNPTIIGECAAMGLAVGVAAGLFPAWQASRMKPVEAMRAR